MKFSRIYLNRLQTASLIGDTVVVIDVLRSFTTAAVALARGARAIYPVDGIAGAQALASRLPDSVLVGAVGGGDPVAGFDFGNSPSALLTADLAGRNVVMSTAAGVRGLQRYYRATQLYAASLLVARATAEAIARQGAREVSFVITGEWVDRDGDEDLVCADYIQALLEGRDFPLDQLAERVRHSDFGERFRSGAWPNLPLADLDVAVAVDRFNFAMPVDRHGDTLIIR